MRSLGADCLRGPLADGLQRIQDDGRPFTIELGGRPVAALVSLDDLGLIGSGKDEDQFAPWAELQRSKALFEQAERLARMGHWEWNDTEDSCSYCSKELAELHGLAVDEYLAQMSSTEGALETIHPDDRQRVQRVWEDSMARGARLETEYRIVRADGGIVHVREVEDRVLNDRGALVRSVGFVQDITSLVQAEEALRKSHHDLEARIKARTADLRAANKALREEVAERRQAEETLRTTRDQLRLISDSLPAMVLYLDAEERFRFANKGARERFGRPQSDIIGRSVRQVLRRSEYERLRPHLTSALRGEYRKFEDRVTYADGTPGEVEVVYVPHLASDETIQGIIVLSTDITERKRAEEAVRTRDAWLRAILENSPIEIAIKDTDGRIMAVSRNVEEETGHAASDFAGRKVSDFLPKSIAELYEAADREVVATGRPKQQEVVERLDGTTRHLLNAKFPLRDDGGEIIGICSLTSDITTEKLGEERLRRAQRMEAVGQLTGGVAHDFNNLLAVIQGNAEFLLETAPEGDSTVQDLLRAARRGAELTRRLLAFSRQQPLRPRALDLAELVSGMEGLLTRTLGATIDVETFVQPGLWAALADPGQVENALLNLAINARDAMPRGGRLTIQCANSQLEDSSVDEPLELRAGDYVVLAVTDDGTGMPPEVLEHALEPFFTTKEVGEGSGLGLSMVYGFAKQSGGHVTLYSEAERGTTVKLYLPRATRRAESDEDQSSVTSPRSRGEAILLIEDDEGVRKLGVKMLESLGYRVIAVPDAASAQTVLDRGEKIDLVLSDVVLPGGVSGPEFAERLKRSKPSLPMIFMSGYPADAALRSGLLEPGKMLLNKPFERRQLAQALRRALETSPPALSATRRYPP